MSDRYVVVTTGKRGVFGGVYVSGEVGGTVVLEDARMCIYWNKETKGVVGLAAGGPQNGCRITDPASQATLADVTAIFDCTDQAREQWERGIWS